METKTLEIFLVVFPCLRLIILRFNQFATQLERSAHASAFKSTTMNVEKRKRETYQEVEQKLHRSSSSASNKMKRKKFSTHTRFKLTPFQLIECS